MIKKPETGDQAARLLTRTETAQFLAISVRTLDRLTRAGSLPCCRVGRSVRYRWRDVKKWL